MRGWCVWLRKRGVQRFSKLWWMVFSRSDKEVPATVGDEVKGLVPPMRQWA